MIFLLSGVNFLFAQDADWVSLKYNQNVPVWETSHAFNSWWGERTYEKGKGFKPFRRWEDEAKRLVGTDGKIQPFAQTWNEWQAWMAANPENKTTSVTPNWAMVGPNSPPSSWGIGRINCITVDPSNSNIIYVATPSGGIWKTTDNGATWATNSDGLAVIGFTTIAIDPNNSNILFAGSGDAMNGHTSSLGIFKSTNAGLTWSLNYSYTSDIHKIVFEPGSSTNLLCGANGALLRSTNGGTSWTPVSGISQMCDIEYRPGFPATVYGVSKTQFFKSVDNGATWSQISTGLPNDFQRLQIAVCATRNQWVYLVGSRSTNGFRGFYLSTDQGNSFGAQSVYTTPGTPNLFGNLVDGSDGGGQAWYDMAMEVNPANRNEVWVGGINIWKSTDAGITWAINTHWDPSTPGVEYVHADIQYLAWQGTSLLTGCDGGIYRTTNSGTNWIDINGNLAINQVDYLANYPAANSLFLGTQDNGNILKDNATWAHVFTGDGMRCIVDPVTPNIVYSSVQYGGLLKSTDGGYTHTYINGGIADFGAWRTPFEMSSFDQQTLLAGYRDVWKTTNGGSTWNKVSNFGVPAEIERLELCEADPNVIVATIYISGFPSEIHLFRTTDGGATWHDYGQGIPFSSGSITAVEISPVNPEKMWLARGSRIFQTTNGGKSWSNYSGTLPAFPVYDIEYETGSADRIFVGTRIGVYYRDNTMNDWASWNTGLPNVAVRALEIYEPTRKLRAGTYGRSVWEADLPDFTSPPTADFHTPRREVCAGIPVQFLERAKGLGPTDTWSWSFPGGMPATSNARNPVVTYPVAGVYNATLTVSSPNGIHSATKTSWITVSAPTSGVLPYLQDFESATFPPTGWKMVNPDLDFTWTRFGGGISGISGPPTDLAAIYMDNYGRYLAGTQDLIISPEFDFGPFAGGTMTFDVGYCKYDTFSNDTLNIWYSTNCGETLLPLFSKGRNDLATFPDLTTSFGPISPDRWRTENVDLTPLANKSNVAIIFDARAWGGNNMWIDNININAGALEVELADFEAWRSGDVAELSWQASSETQGTQYEIQRQNALGDFEAIGTLEGGNTPYTPYSYTDNAPLLGENHYRLRMLDQEGNSQYSIVRTVVFDENTNLELSVNFLAGHEELRITLEAGSMGKAMVQVVNVEGKILAEMDWDVQVGRNRMLLNAGNWASGLYFVRILHPNEGRKTARIPKF